MQKWTGVFVGRCHNERVRLAEIAEAMGVSRAYVTMILSGKRNPPDAKERMYAALKTVTERRENDAQRS